MNIIKVSSALLLTVFLLFGCGEGGSVSETYTTAEGYIESKNFVGSVLIKKNDVDILRKGFGWADKHQQLQNSVDTRYRIGSLTKAFTALAIVQLKMKYLIGSYDDPVSNYITDYPNGEEITIRHLLMHRSGIPDYSSIVNPNQVYTPVELVNLFKNKSLEFDPGEKYQYSNSNYFLLGYLIETLSGHGYENYLQINVLSPLGMINTEYGSSIIEGTGYAMGYTNTSQEQKADFHDMSIPYSAGALSSNIGDLEIWAESFAAGTLVSDQENQEIFMEGDHEFGWFVGEFAGKTAYSYYGGINGFSSFIAIFPEEKGLIIALSNVEGEQPKLNSIVTTITKNEL